MRKPLALNDFCMRQFKDPASVGFIPCEPKDFLKKVNDIYLNGYEGPSVGMQTIIIQRRRYSQS